MATIESVLKENGLYMGVAEGNSMRPLIRPNIDTIVIEKTTGYYNPMDVILYRVGDKNIILHRVLKRENDSYLVSGDNCTYYEHVKQEQILGKLTGLYRGEKKVSFDSFAYRMYVNLWCRNHNFRIFLVRCKNKMVSVLVKIKKMLFVEKDC